MKGFILFSAIDLQKFMAGIVAILLKENGKSQNLVTDLYNIGRGSQNRANGGYIIKVQNKPVAYGTKSLPDNSEDPRFKKIVNSKSSGYKGICYVTRNANAVQRLLKSNFYLDGYFRDESVLLDPVQLKKKFLSTEKKLLSLYNEGDLDGMAQFFSDETRGIGVLGTRDGFVILRESFRTGWLTDLGDRYVFTQENYIFQIFGDVKYEEVEPGQAVKITKKDKKEGQADYHKPEFDSQEVVNIHHPSTVVFGKSTARHRKDIAGKIMDRYGGEIKDAIGREKVVFNFSYGPVTTAIEVKNRLREVDSDPVRYDEVLIKRRDSYMIDQQRSFSIKKKFSDYYDFNSGADVQGNVLVGITDTLITSGEASGYASVITDQKAAEGFYITMQVPIINKFQVGFFTVPKNLYMTKFLKDIESGRISTVRQLNEAATRDISKDMTCKIRMMPADDLAEAILKNSGTFYTKENIWMPPLVGNMPFE